MSNGERKGAGGGGGGGEGGAGGGGGGGEGGAGGGGGGGEGGAGAGDSPWFTGAGGSVGLGVEGFNSLTSTDSGLAGGDQEAGEGTDLADAAAAESADSSEDYEGDQEGDVSSISDGETYDGSDAEGGDGSQSQGSITGGESDAGNDAGSDNNETADSEGDNEDGDEAQNTMSDGEFDEGNDTEVDGEVDNNESSDSEGDNGKNNSEDAAKNDSETTPENNQPEGPRSSTGFDYTRLTDWRGSNYETGPKSPEKPKDTLEHASKTLDQHQESSREKTDESAREQGTKREGQEPSGGGAPNQPTKSRMFPKQRNRNIFAKRNGAQDTQDMPLGSETNKERQKRKFLGVNWQEMVKRKGGSAVSRTSYLPKGGGGRLSDGKRPMEPSDKVGVEMKRLKTRTEAVSAWNSEAVQAYRGGLMKAPGAGGSLARERRRWENPGGVA